MKKKSKIVSFILSAVMTASTVAGSFALAVPTANPEREADNAAYSRYAATQGMVLFKNENEQLPYKENDKIAVFGSGQVHTIKGGLGSGNVNNKQSVNILQGIKNSGLNYDETLASMYEEWCAKNPRYVQETAMNSIYPSNKEWPLSLDQVQASKDRGSNKAVVVISRITGEFNDRTLNGRTYTADRNEPNPVQLGDYYLSDREITLLNNVKAVYGSNVTILLNVGGPMDLSFTNDVDSVLYMSQAGQQGGYAVADVLTGDVTPSGKLTTTWAEEYTDYPAKGNFGGGTPSAGPRSIEVTYEEDIYVGYRYFDTFGITPKYEFGYGLSYTTFETKTTNVTRTGTRINVSVTVTNTGDTYTGKEVVQVYYSAPGKDGLERAYQELVAYTKTDDIAPGESQNVTVSFDLTDMRAYDEAQAAYILEKGDYVIRVGNSSRNTKAEAVITLGREKATSQVDNRLVPEREIDKLSNVGATPYTYEGEAQEIANARKIVLSSAQVNQLITTKNNVSTVTTEPEEMVVAPEDEGKTYTLVDVAEGNATLEQVIAQMSDNDLMVGVLGSSGRNTGEPVVGSDSSSVAGAAGETKRNAKYFIPNFVVADGPAGLRITRTGTVNGETYEQNCTAFPIGTLMAMTWDIDVIQEAGRRIGVELVEYNVDIWLAPSLNIHRDPLCGRNFEYYSEDPVISGKTAAAATKGVQSNDGIGVSLKHYAMNQQETSRNNMDTIASERTVRDIYLKGFEIAVKESNPWTIMTAYNDINGTPCADSFDLSNAIARGEWGFDGLIMTDWGGGQSNPAISMTAGNDLIMPGASSKLTQLQQGYAAGICTKADLQRSMYNILTVAMRTNAFIRAYDSVLDVDKSELEAAIAAVEAMDFSNYTPNSVAALQVVLDEAKAIVASNTVTQAQVKEMAEKVLGAPAEILVDRADTTLLEMLMQYARENEPEYLNKIVKQALDDKMASAQAMIDDGNATQDEVDNMYDELLGVVQMFEFLSDPRALQETIDRAEVIKENLNHYANDGKDAFLSALENAYTVLEDPLSFTEDYEDAREALETAMAALKRLDLSELNKTIALAEGFEAKLDKYLEAGKQEFIDALAAARAIIQNGGTAEEIKNSTDALMDAILGLRLIPNKDALAGLVAQTKAKDLSLYTVETVAVLLRAQAKAEEVLADETATIDDVNDAAVALRNADTGLQPMTTTDDNSSDDASNGSSKDNSTEGSADSVDSPKTGTESIAVVFALMAVAGLAVLVLKKRSK